MLVKTMLAGMVMFVFTLPFYAFFAPKEVHKVTVEERANMPAVKSEIIQEILK